ncbi:SRR1-like protein [Sabethes cyaneus]|uniref:SRR1-like protein n=1 Tax=Sabethes cyaneus TaxID=53552 RepID=UPI00237E3FCD|nr:SRR1-like protein [Sabethes cyaneus]
MSNEVKISKESDGFVLVTATRKKRRSKHLKRHSELDRDIFEHIKPSQDCSGIDTSLFLQNFAKTEDDLVSSDFFRETVKLVVPLLNQAQIKNIICLGLGKLSQCPVARYQLAFIRRLKEELEQFDGKIKIFDPVFNQQDVDILQRLDTILLTENQEGKYLTDCKTLFYLPHCPKQISNNLLWKNWQPELLKNVYLICNSFENIIVNNPERLLKENAAYILKAEKYCKEIRLENNFKHTDIFNDFSLHYFDTSALPNNSNYFWQSEEPNYTEENLELVTRRIQAQLKFINGHV